MLNNKNNSHKNILFDDFILFLTQKITWRQKLLLIKYEIISPYNRISLKTKRDLGVYISSDIGRSQIDYAINIVNKQLSSS